MLTSAAQLAVHVSVPLLNLEMEGVHTVYKISINKLLQISKHISPRAMR